MNKSIYFFALALLMGCSKPAPVAPVDPDLGSFAAGTYIATKFKAISSYQRIEDDEVYKLVVTRIDPTHAGIVTTRYPNDGLNDPKSYVMTLSGALGYAVFSRENNGRGTIIGKELVVEEFYSPDKVYFTTYATKQ